MRISSIKNTIHFRRYLKKENTSIFFFFTVSLCFFIFFEWILISVFSRFTFLDISYLLLWQIATISLNIIIINAGIRHRYFRLLYFSVIAVISGTTIIILNNFKNLVGLKAFFIILFLIGISGNYFSLKFVKKKKKEKSKRNKIRILFILIFSSMFIGSIWYLTFPEKKIIIKPETYPEIIFWTSPYDLPDDQNIYEICKQYNIGFMPAINAGTLNISSLMRRYKLAIDNGVNLYFCLLTSGDPYMNMDTTEEFVPLYNRFKAWFKAEGIFDSTFVKAFAVDAEPPGEYIEKVQEKSFVYSINYLTDNFPTKKEIKEATENIKELVEEIRADGKEAGIIRISPYLDELDEDGDIELLIRNVYSLDVVWDFSITMIYRIGAAIVDMGDAVEDIADDMKKNVFGRIEKEKINILSAYNFYHRVGMTEKECGDFHANNHYIFVGTLKKVFNDTDYMEDKEYLDDIDICRHFGKGKVFLYNYENFIANYGILELINLGKHIQQDDSWELEHLAAEVQINIIFYLALAFLDRLLFLES